MVIGSGGARNGPQLVGPGLGHARSWKRRSNNGATMYIFLSHASGVARIRSYEYHALIIIHGLAPSQPPSRHAVKRKSRPSIRVFHQGQRGWKVCFPLRPDGFGVGADTIQSPRKFRVIHPHVYAVGANIGALQSARFPFGRIAQRLSRDGWGSRQRIQPDKSRTLFPFAYIDRSLPTSLKYHLITTSPSTRRSNGLRSTVRDRSRRPHSAVFCRKTKEGQILLATPSGPAHLAPYWKHPSSPKVARMASVPCLGQGVRARHAPQHGWPARYHLDQLERGS